VSRSELTDLSAWRIVEGTTGGQFSVAEVVEAHLERMEAGEPALNALITPLPEEARSRAQALDAARARREELGPLFGVPVILKDNLCTRGIRTTCGSRILENWIPPYDAAVVEFLEAAGAVILGKANMDEFAMGSSTENSAYGPVSNPWDLSRVPGGSSGGSAASVAAGYVPLALGSDTGGSIRQPAAFCGVQGMKPTYGSVSRYGLVAYGSSLDQIGPLAREVADLALCLEVIARPDPRDSTCLPGERPNYLRALHVDRLKGTRIGLLRGYDAERVEDPLRRALIVAARILQDAGAEILDVGLPTSMEYGLPAYYILAPAEASSNLARYDGVQYGLSRQAETLSALYRETRAAGFGAEVKRRILTGTYVLSSGYYDAYYLTALKARRRIRDEFDSVFRRVDAILSPTAPTLPFRKGEHTADPIQMYLSDIFTIPVNLAGLPAVSVYANHTAKGLPTAVQLVGPRNGDRELLRIAAVLEREIGVPRIAGLEEEC
jgi:aspartyl-tRNA(Asn)/glutamyl-tRNA(Gln) amidotransferase subunit A